VRLDASHAIGKTSVCLSPLASHTQLADAGAGIELAYETFEENGATPVVLIHGLATQMLGWPAEFCARLADRGHRVTRFDNRDVGLSSHLHQAPPVDLAALLSGDSSSAPYRLHDMAADTVGLLDALGLDAAHFVGASMGGTIAQTLAIDYPQRVLSLTSIMSTTGNPGVGQPTAEAMAAILAPPARDRSGAIERAVRAYRVVASPGFPFDELEVRDRAARSFERAHDPGGVLRQLAAVAASGDRTAALRRVSIPTLVVHGRDDIVAAVSGGIATADAIPEAELLVIDGMGHDLPRAVWPQLIDRISQLVERANVD
jgi:pimeloyl-ACP methyl ester carboxylesterase